MGPNKNTVRCSEGFPRPGPVVAKSQSTVPHPETRLLTDKFMRFTHGVIPASPELTTKVGLPVGVVLRPFAEIEAPEELPVITSTTGRGQAVIRCVKCRTYINPYCKFTDGGKRWVCSMCRVLNDVTSDYYYPLDAEGNRKDLNDHPELLHCMTEFLAPSEYIQRPPQRPSYIFCIDTSFASAQTGYLARVCASLKSSIDSIKGDPQVAVVTFDQFVSVYNLNPRLKKAKTMVVPEMTSDTWLEDSNFKEKAHAAIEAIALPLLADDVLVPLCECRELIIDLFDRIPVIAAKRMNADCATGPALAVAMKILFDKGGKISLFSAGRPSVGVGRLKDRDNQKLYGTKDEHTLLKPAENVFYTKLSFLASQEQISVDTYFLKGRSFLDMSTLSILPKTTTGHVYVYNSSMDEREVEKLHAEVYEGLSREAGFEAVMRVRVSAGWKVRSIHGHFQFRSTDLMSVPNVDPSKTYVAELVPHNTTPVSHLCIQCAVLYTTANRERRLRVHTARLEVSKSYSKVVSALDSIALSSLICRQALDALDTSFDNARTSLVDKNVQHLKGYRKALTEQNDRIGNQLFLPTSTAHLPLFTLSLLKSCLFRKDTKMGPDMRQVAMRKVSQMSAEDLVNFMIPKV